MVVVAPSAVLWLGTVALVNAEGLSSLLAVAVRSPDLSGAACADPGVRGVFDRAVESRAARVLRGGGRGVWSLPCHGGVSGLGGGVAGGGASAGCGGWFGDHGPDGVVGA